jgi:hypothetical protein
MLLYNKDAIMLDRIVNVVYNIWFLSLTVINVTL